MKDLIDNNDPEGPEVKPPARVLNLPSPAAHIPNMTSFEVHAFGDVALFDDPEFAAAVTGQMVEEMGLHALNRLIHPFEPQGTTVLVVLAESHLAIHTWPEYRFLHLSMVTCGTAPTAAQVCAAVEHAAHVSVERLKIEKVPLDIGRAA